MHDGIRMYWWVTQAALYRGLATVIKLTSPEFLIRNVVSELGRLIVERLIPEYAGVVGSKKPENLVEYLKVAEKAHQYLSGLGANISNMRVVAEDGVVRVEVSNAVPSMQILPEEDRPYAMLVSISVVLGVVEAVTGKQAHLKVPSLGIELPGPGPEIVVDVDVPGNRFVATIRNFS